MINTMFSRLGLFCLLPALAAACDSCYGPTDLVEHERLVRRIQPGAQGSPNGPKSALEWGTLNFLHTTDTHGWLEGHLKEANYGADWGDFVTFTRHMKQKAGNMGVDLLLVDTGDLHDGAGLSDATSPNGRVTNPIFEEIDYDLLTIGNHELYVTDIAYETFNQFAKFYGDKYLTSNVQIINPSTGQFEYIGKQYRYFTTEKGYRIMAFGVLFDFTGNSNVSKVIKAADMIKQKWFIDAVNTPQPVDLFLLIGHNAIKGSSSTVNTVYNAIRSSRPSTPIQIFGGHTHIRDFVVYDGMTTGLESGRYCETVGWLAMQGLPSTNYKGIKNAHGVPNPTRKAIRSTTGSTAAASATPTANTTSSVLYARRYLDWNRQTFAYHAVGSQDGTFDYHSGLRVTGEITDERKKLNLTSLYGCAPQTWCMSCQPFMSNGNIFSLLSKALSATVVNPSRSTVPRFIIINTGSIRFDLVQGPFTYDDSFIVSPFDDAFQYIPNVPYAQASKVLNILNGGAYQKRAAEPEYSSNLFDPETACKDPVIGDVSGQSEMLKRSTRGHLKRQSTTLTPGYTTSDDFGTDGDDTAHSAIPYFAQPNDLQANASFPTDGSTPAVVDLVFLDYIGANYIIPALTKLGANYTKADIQAYLPTTFTTNSYLPLYAKITPEWQANVPNCPVGKGVGY